MLDMVAKSLLDILKSKSNFSEDKIESLMKKETSFDSSEMLEAGLIDEIIKTEVVLDQDVHDLSASALYNIYNSILNEKENEMKKIQEHFKLGSDATEDAILNSISTLETTISNHAEETSASETALSKAQSDLAELQTKYTAINDSLAETIVDAAVEAGKIEKTKKDIWLDAAKKDTEAVKAQLGTLSTVSNVSVQTAVVNTAGAAKVVKPEDNIIDYVRNNGQALIDLQESDPTRFEEIMNLYENETSKFKTIN